MPYGIVAARRNQGNFIIFNGYTGQILMKMINFDCSTWCIIKDKLQFT